MPTLNPRINLTLEQYLFTAVNEVAKKTKKSLSAIAKELIIEALENREDMELSAIANKRHEESDGKLIAAENFWNKYEKQRKNP